jgi:hypothetical protein
LLCRRVLRAPVNGISLDASDMNAPKVFVSYSREGREHENWVLQLAASLRRNGVDAALDQWDLKPGSDMTLFMESQIRDSDFVILICTPTYAQKSNIPSGGVGYEKNIISAEMLQSRDLRPKFIPVLRDGDFNSALPTYLGSKFAIDFRPSREQADALGELLRAIHEVPPSSKPTLGPSPFTDVAVPATPASQTVAVAPLIAPVSIPPGAVGVSGHVESWEQRALGRFNFLRETRINKEKEDPFASGYWQASFALQGSLRNVSLPELLEILRKSKTNRTGWDIGWVPTHEGIAPYPFQDGIEVWLAEDGGKGPAHSDFWRAEKIGTFSLFRGYQEDEADFAKRYPNIKLDYSLVLWRVSEFLLYLENFASNLGAGPVAANIRIRWTGLENRRLGNHNAMFGFGTLGERICRQPTVESALHIDNTSIVKKTLIRDVQTITRPLFEVFDFFSLNEKEVKALVQGLFDADKEGI